MSAEINRTNFTNIPLQIFNEKDMTKIDEFFHEDYMERAPLPPGWPTGREGVRQFFGEMLTAFPDLHVTVEQALADGEELVAGRLSMQGTHLGSFMGIPASGKVINWTECHFGRMRDGKVVEHWTDFDELGMLRQMGVIPDMQPQEQPPSERVS